MKKDENNGKQWKTMENNEKPWKNLAKMYFQNYLKHIKLCLFCFLIAQSFQQMRAFGTLFLSSFTFQCQ